MQVDQSDLPIRPGLEMEDGILRILGHFLEQLFESIGLGGKDAVIRERCVKVDSVKRFEAGGVLGQTR